VFIKSLIQYLQKIRHCNVGILNKTVTGRQLVSDQRNDREMYGKVGRLYVTGGVDVCSSSSMQPPQPHVPYCSDKPRLADMGGATRGCGGYDVPPTFAICTPQGVQRNLRCTPAGYYRLVATAGRKSYAIIHIRL